MTTPKTKSTPIRSDAAADLALKRLGDLTRLKATAKATADGIISDAREALRDAVAPFDTEIRSLKRKLETFAKRRLDSWLAGDDGDGPRKSNSYTHGEIGFRSTPSTISQRGVDEAALLANLKAAGLVHCIREYEAPDWHALNREDDATLGLLGLSRKGGGDRFYLDFTVPHDAEPRRLTQPTPRTFQGKPLDLLDPDSVELDYTDLAIHLSRVCRHTGAIWSCSLQNAVLGAALCDQLCLDPWTRAHVVARVLPDAFLGVLPPGLADTLPGYQLLRETWARSLRRRLGLLETEPDFLQVVVDTVARRQLVIELHAGNHRSRHEAAAMHGGAPTTAEKTAWATALHLAVRDRARLIRPGRPVAPSNVVPIVRRALLRAAIDRVAGEDFGGAAQSAVARSWTRLIGLFPSLLYDTDGDPIAVPEELRPARLPA